MCTVVTKALDFVSHVVVVDDACPDNSAEAVRSHFGLNERVTVVRHEHNCGVGAATKTGIELALRLGADVVIKIDADDQMDVAYIPDIEALFRENADVAFVKGNRFMDARVLKVMPRVRLFGNAVLSILAKLASGYWGIVDPTNGFVAFNSRILTTIDWRAFADGYFFELSVLCTLGLRRCKIASLGMTAIYGSEQSSLSIRRVVATFPPLLLRRFIRRILLQYFLLDFNVGSVCCLAGAPLTLLGGVIGLIEWYISVHFDSPRPTGTIMMVALCVISGGQLLFGSLLYDVLTTPQIVDTTLGVIGTADSPQRQVQREAEYPS